jgi:hypothetical protein
MNRKLWSSPLLAWMLVLFLAANAAQAKKSNQSQEESIPYAAIYGMAGESYVLYGTGGITIEETPKPGMWHSNLKTYKINVDGSGMAGGSFSTFRPATDFNAVASFAYFVSQPVTCTLPTATAAAGKEIIVCNTGANNTITYSTTNGETISGAQSGAVTNSTAYKVDRFISDGTAWYRE